MAALHCLGLGWWSPHAIFYNLFVLPSNLIALLFVREATAPSPALAALVKARIADQIVPQLQAAAMNARNDPNSGGTLDDDFA